MRIIDNKTDFYDFYQNIYRDDSITFDRTDSFMLTKDVICQKLRYNFTKKFNASDNVFALLQVCNTFWLFMISVTETSDYGDVVDFNIKLLHAWSNYNKEYCLIKFKAIKFNYKVFYAISDWNRKSCKHRLNEDKLNSKINILVDAIDRNNYTENCNFDSYAIKTNDNKSWEYEKQYKTKHIPILIASGFANFIDPLDMYLSIEQYFSFEKQSTERTESIGLTDREKIENHGFDVRKSFRGK